MDKYSGSTVRNVILVSHSGAGKTSLADAMLFSCKQVSRQGSVDEGNSVSDYDPIEINHKTSINASILHCISGKTKINIIDTPGYADFITELRNCVPASDSGIVVISAVDGIEVGTSRVWQILGNKNIPRSIFISKLGKENADFYKVVDEIQKEFGKQCTPLFLPIGSQSGFSGVANLLTKEGWDKLSAEEQSKAAAYREAFIEIAAEAEDALVEKYLNGEELTQDEICRAFKIAFKENKVVPIFCGSSVNQLGIKELIEKIVNYFPAPSSWEKVNAFEAEGDNTVEVITKESELFSGYVFKTVSDPYVGQLSIFRVVSGVINSNTEFYNVKEGASERIGQLYILQGKEQIPVEAVAAGDIGAVAKLKNTHTGDSISDPKRKIRYEVLSQVEPSISFSLKPKTRQDEEKISQALSKMTVEDLGLRVSRDSQTKELIISGMGNMHLEIAIERLKTRYHVEVEVGTPKVAYKETIKKSTKMHHKHKKQSGGKGQYGDVWIEVSPLERGKEFEFVNKIVGGAIPRQYIPSVEKGVRNKMIQGVLAGYPLVDVQVTLYDGSYHDVDSSDMAFQIAGGMALKKAVLESSPVLLEPVMEVEVVIPDECMGAINGDLSSRRGRVQGMEQAGKNEKIKALVPLSEMLKYATDLKSMTQGRGSYTMTFSHYDEVPHKIAEKIIAQAKIEDDEDH
jgi:elongation factor G